MFRLLQIAVTLLASLVGLNVHADVIDGEELDDPTRPLFVSEADGGDADVLAMIRNVVPASYDLSFIRAGSSPIAVINSERVTVGDLIGGATVIAIERSSVTLSINGNEQRISLYGENIKSATTQ